MKLRQSVLFLIDTQGANCVGCYQPALNLGTPQIDRLASEGVRFAHATTCAPVCSPARSAIFTGLYPHSNGVLANDLAPHLGLPTIGQRLRDTGITTGYIGKWHLDGGDYFGDGRCPAGWDPAFWFDGRNYLDSLPNDQARDLSRQVLGPAEVARHGITSEFTHAHRIADRAIEFIRQNHTKDFLLVVSIDEPHHPSIAPEPFVSEFEHFLFPVSAGDDPLENKPAGQREWARHAARAWDPLLLRRDGGVRLRHPRHFSCNSYADSQVGRILGEVDSLTPEALVIYTSDHGDMLGSHRLHGKGPCMYDEIVRVPLIVRWPGAAPAAMVSPGLVSHIDLVPTFLEYFGLHRPDLLQGRSLLRQIREPAHRTNDHIFIEFNRFEVDHDGFGAFAPIRCISDGRFKLAINLLDTDELYDRELDPQELRNRIDDPACSETRDTLHDCLLDWMNRTRDPLRGPHWARRPWSTRNSSTWGGATRPRPFDERYFPKSLLYDSGRIVDRYEYAKD